MGNEKKKSGMGMLAKVLVAIAVHVVASAFPLAAKADVSPFGAGQGPDPSCGP